MELLGIVPSQKTHLMPTDPIEPHKSFLCGILPLGKLQGIKIYLPWNVNRHDD